MFDLKKKNLNVRHYKIIDFVREHGYASIETLSKQLGVSSQTIRRDIVFLDNQVILKRHHGGVGILPGTKSLSYSSREIENVGAKNLIGAAVASQISNGTSLFIDIGTTMEAVAEGLLNHQGLTIITNHIGVALILSKNPDFTILIPGGQLRSRDKAITGESALEFLNKNRVAYGIFGIGSITDDGHLLDYDYRDAQLSRHAMAVCSTKFVAADHSKFNSQAMMPISHVSEINSFFTDKMPPQCILNTLNTNGTNLYIGPNKIYS